jgi:oligopeptide transport system permease protein
MAGITGKDIKLTQYAEELEKAGPEGRSLTQDAVRRLVRNKAALVSIILITLIVLIAFIGPYFVPWSFDKVDWSAIRKPPDFAKGHYFGTDVNGRDVLARMMQGTQMSLIVALVATSVSVTIGITYGSIAGYFGGRVDAVMMRFVDIMYAMPYILFVIILVVIFGRSPVLLFVGIGALEWLTMARIVRGQTLSLKEREFIEAARAGGAGSGTIIRGGACGCPTCRACSWGGGGGGGGVRGRSSGGISCPISRGRWWSMRR